MATPPPASSAVAYRPRWFHLHNLRSRELLELDGTPMDYEVPLPPSSITTKQGFRAWCEDITTEGMFLSLVEPCLAGERVHAASNAPLFLHGLIADYDDPELSATRTDEILTTLDNRLTKLNVPIDARPSHLHRTFSNKLRLIWTFGKRVSVSNVDFTAAFLSEWLKLTRADKLFPQFDKKSLDLSQYFHSGSGWMELYGQAPISSALLLQVERAACDRASGVLGREDLPTAIPIDAVAAEVEKQYPGIWPGEFKVGARGPAFWLNDGRTDSLCAIVCDHGMFCHSDRAEGFHSWSTILRGGFVQSYEASKLAACVEGVYHLKDRYWYLSPKGWWISSSSNDFADKLLSLGLSSKVLKGQEISEERKARIYIRENQPASGVAPFLYSSQGAVVHYNDGVYLNDSRLVAMAPSSTPDPANWPWLHEYFWNIWEQVDHNGVPPRDYFLTWLKRFYESARNKNLSSGHALVIAGPTGRGKTLLSNFILGTIFGRSEEATDYLTGRSDFNESLVASPVWTVDDNTSSSNYSDHKRFGDRLKKFVANPFLTYRKMYAPPVQVPWKGRIVITCNLDSHSITTIPELGPDVLDKFMLMKFGDWQPKFGPSRENETRIREELPHFLAWLLEWQPPAELMSASANDRFGFAPMLHEDLVESSRANSNAQWIGEIIEKWIPIYKSVSGTTDDVWEGSVTDLLSELHEQPGFSELLRGIKPNIFSRDLGRLQDDFKFILPRKRTMHRRLVRIALNPEYKEP